MAGFQQDFTRPVRLEATNTLTVHLTNDLGVSITRVLRSGETSVTNLWPRYRPFQANNGSFQVPILTNWAALPLIGYSPGQGFFDVTNPVIWDTSQELLAPRWGVTVSHRLHAQLIDLTTGRLIDHVLLDAGDIHRLLTDEISFSPADNPDPYALLWSTNPAPAGLRSGRPGATQQILISLGAEGIPPGGEWQRYGSFFTPAATTEITAFRFFFLNSSNLVAAVPYSPVVQRSHAVHWQANDPVVHQMPADLRDASSIGDFVYVRPPQTIVTQISYKILASSTPATALGQSMIRAQQALILLASIPPCGIPWPMMRVRGISPLTLR